MEPWTDFLIDLSTDNEQDSPTYQRPVNDLPNLGISNLEMAELAPAYVKHIFTKEQLEAIRDGQNITDYFWMNFTEKMNTTEEPFKFGRADLEYFMEILDKKTKMGQTGTTKEEDEAKKPGTSAKMDEVGGKKARKAAKGGKGKSNIEEGKIGGEEKKKKKKKEMCKDQAEKEPNSGGLPQFLKKSAFSEEAKKILLEQELDDDEETETPMEDIMENEEEFQKTIEEVEQKRREKMEKQRQWEEMQKKLDQEEMDAQIAASIVQAEVDALEYRAKVGLAAENIKEKDNSGPSTSNTLHQQQGASRPSTSNNTQYQQQYRPSCSGAGNAGRGIVGSFGGSKRRQAVNADAGGGTVAGTFGGSKRRQPVPGTN